MNRRTAGNRIVLMTVLGLTVIVVGLILIRPLPQQNPSLEIRKKSLVILRNSLHEQDPYARSAAAKAMGDSNNPAVLSWLMAGSKPRVRSATARAGPAEIQMICPSWPKG